MFRQEPSKTAFKNSIDREFVLIPTGSFMMGTSIGDSNERPLHEVKFSRPFYLQKTEVSQGEWKKVMEDNPPSSGKCGDNCPVSNVSWDDAKEFIKRLNAMEGTDKYRLPIDAEWEYACRAGTTAEYSFGDDASNLGKYAWYGDNSKKSVHPVATKKPNAWGLYDMHGNVWEWVEDDYHRGYEGAPADGRAWVDNPRRTYRVVRGKAFDDDAHWYTSSVRGNQLPTRPSAGFRVAKSVGNGP